MGLKIVRSLIAVLLFLITTIFANADTVVRLEQIPWPELKTCNECVDFQFVTLKMRLPIKDIGELVVVNLPYSNLTITLQNDAKSKEERSISFLVQEPDKLTTTFKKIGYFDEHGIKNNENFFDVIGSYRPNESLLIMRKVMGLDKAVGYFKASKGPIHAYRIHGKHPKEQYIYIVVEGDKDVYLIAGDIDDTLYEKILSNLTLSQLTR